VNPKKYFSVSESIEWNGNAWAKNCKFEGNALASMLTSGGFMLTK
jgi:hypothetical protein